MTVEEFKNLLEEASDGDTIAFRLPDGAICYGVVTIVQTRRIDIEDAKGEIIVTLQEEERS